MRWLILIGIFVLGVGLSLALFRNVGEPQSQSPDDSAAAPTAAAPHTTPVRLVSFFIPYWQLDGSSISLPAIDYAPDALTRLIYFGVSVNEDGIAQDDPGYQNLSLFLEKAPAGSSKYLGVRMTNHDQNVGILANPAAQQKIIDDTIQQASDKRFDGIVLDLELTPTLNERVPAQINTFVETFYNASRSKNIKFAITMYGDTFYRRRPYDIAYLMKVTDEIMIMAYDFHKSIGEPGPNFPLRGRDEFGYDLETLMADVDGVPDEKLTVIYGMYGYDWTVDEKKRPIKRAEVATLAQIKKNFIGPCAKINCVSTRDKNAAENQIEFVNNAEYHVVWYDDMESTRLKTEFIGTRGVGSIAYWAYGYF